MGCQCSNEGLVAQRSEADGAVPWCGYHQSGVGHGGDTQALTRATYRTLALCAVTLWHTCRCAVGVPTRLCTMELLGQLALGSGVEREGEGGSHHRRHPVTNLPKHHCSRCG